MTNQDYESKKRECWEEFCFKNPAFNDMLGRKIFNQIFNRAYALGKKAAELSSNSEQLNAEGEEMLTVSRKQIDALQDEIFKAIMDAHDADDWQDAAHYILDVMPRSFAALFGSKCMPDENSSNVEKLEKNDEDYNVDSSEQKAAGPKYGSDDKVTLNGCGGFVITSSYLDPYTREYKYRLGGFKGHFCESDLEAYTEPEKEAAKMNPIESKVSVYIATKEEDEEFRRILHNNGFKWNTGSSLKLDTFWSSCIEETKIYYLHPDKVVTYYGEKKFDTLTFAEFKKQYFEKEPLNLSQVTANCDKHFDNILKDSFAKERRLNIATTIIERIIKSEYYSLSEKYREDNIKEMVKVSLQITDAIMTECEKGGDNEKAQ